MISRAEIIRRLAFVCLLAFCKLKMVLTLSKDRDGGKWKVDPVETQRRRELSWELFSYDSWQSLTLGRPPSFALPHIDAKMPFLTNVTDDQACALQSYFLIQS